MYRIIDGNLHQKQLINQFNVKVHEFPDGSSEILATQAHEWQPVDQSNPEVYYSLLSRHLNKYSREQWTDEQHEEYEQLKRNIADRRAKTKVRRLCKAIQANCLLTLTYKLNQTDLQLTKKHLKAFNRKLRKVIPDFQYVATFEQQKRGAWHVHIACPRIAPVYFKNGTIVKSFNLIRAIWRSVTKEYGGNADISQRRRNTSTSKIATYISKYITKDTDERPPNQPSYTSSRNIRLQPPIDLGNTASSMLDLIELLYSLYDDSIPTTTFLYNFGTSFFVCLEPPNS